MLDTIFDYDSNHLFTPVSPMQHMQSHPGMIRSLLTLGRSRELLLRLVKRDLTVRYSRSFLGVAWALGEPLLMMLLFYVVFSSILRFDIANYPAFVLCGLVVWSFTQTSVLYALTSISNNANLIKKIYFPREVLPGAVVLGRLFHFVLSAALLVPVFGLLGVGVSSQLLYLPVVLLVQVLLTMGLALLLAALATLYGDVGFLTTFAFQGLFYLSPVFYPLSAVPDVYRSLYMLNPMAVIISSYRNIILHHQAPLWPELGGAALIGALLFVIGYITFKRLEYLFAEVL